MEHVGFRIPDYLKARVENFMDEKGMSFTDSMKFFIDDYFKRGDIVEEITLKINGNGGNPGGLDPDVEEAIVGSISVMLKDVDLIKKILIVIGNIDSRWQRELKEILPNHFEG